MAVTAFPRYGFADEPHIDFVYRFAHTNNLLNDV